MDDFLEYLENKLEGFDFKKLIFPTFILLLYLAGFLYLITIINKKEEVKINHEQIAYVKEEKNEDIYVDIKGSVLNPGVYKLKNNSRVIDAIKESGGITKDANTRFINLSKRLEDGDVIVVYSNTEIKEAEKQETIYVETPCICEEVKNDACFKEENKAKVKTNNKVNINTASLAELETLTGIGEAKAKSIIDYRTKNGKFKTIDDIKNVSGISETIFSKIKENITI